MPARRGQTFPPTHVLSEGIRKKYPLGGCAGPMASEGVEKLRAGSREELLEKLRERIVGFAASRIQRDAAEDLAQEVLILLHEKYGHLERLEDLLPLSLQIVRYKMMALRRKAQRRGEYTQVPVEEIQLADHRVDPLAAAQQREMRERLIAAISKMEERCRKLFALKLEGKSFAEIQDSLGAGSINTIYTWDFRCRKHLLELMGGAWEVLT
jgi:RNA polymerase sigma-70 factor (ECF subfamily)